MSEPFDPAKTGSKPGRQTKKSSHHTAGYINRHVRKINSPPEGELWDWLTIEMLESAAFRSLSIHARRALDRVIVEHWHQGGKENGRLKITWSNFQKFGVSRRYVGIALDELIAAGFLQNTIPGRRAHGADKGEPAQYALTWLPIIEPGNLIPAPDNWRKPQPKPKRAIKIFSPSSHSEPVSGSHGGTGENDLSGSHGEPKTGNCLVHTVVLPSISCEGTTKTSEGKTRGGRTAKTPKPPPIATSATPAITTQSAPRPKPASGGTVAGRQQVPGDFRIEDYTAILHRKGEWLVIDSEFNAVPTGRFNDDGTPVEYFSDRMAAWSHIDKLRAAVAGEKINLGMEPVMKTIVRDMIDLTKRSSSKARTPARLNLELRENLQKVPRAK